MDYVNSSDVADFETVFLLFPGASFETSNKDRQDFKNNVLPIFNNLKIHLEIDNEKKCNPEFPFKLVLFS